jgi:NADH-quinone oxidoreductase subunit K
VVSQTAANSLFTDEPITSSDRPDPGPVMIPLSYYVIVSTTMFVIGLIGVLIRRNFLIILYSIELMLNAANINLVAFSHYFQAVDGQVITLFIITIAAGEAAVGLAIIIVLFRKKATTNVDEINLLRG